MKKRKILIPVSILILISFALLGYVGTGEEKNFSERVKIALRESGNRLLLANNDPTSIILPIIELDKNSFKMSFQNKLGLVPDSVVSIIGHSLEASGLPNNYIVEVIDRDSREVSYSYVIKETGKNIIPCLGRNLPPGHYEIKVLFTEGSYLILDKNYSLLSLVMLGFVGFGLLRWNKEKTGISQIESHRFSKIGRYKFYKEQHKLVIGNKTIELSSKECELLSIFSERPNQIIRRELLVKEIWEDNGVFVGRSLDTFISRIRKKLKDDVSINIVSIHGVGYKLEIS